MINKKIIKVWIFESSSDPSKTYETLQYEDGSTSCGCPGWTRRAQRICKHTRAVHMGLADSQCIASHDYQTDTTPQPVAQPIPTPATPKKATKAQPKSSVKPKVRKISWK